MMHVLYTSDEGAMEKGSGFVRGPGVPPYLLENFVSLDVFDLGARCGCDSK